MSEFHSEFIKVFDNLFNLGSKDTKVVRELYNEESYIFKNKSSLINIKEKYLSKYNLVTPHSPLVRRYAKFLFDNFQERFE